jgi:SAM-dependent methyltransferase
MKWQRKARIQNSIAALPVGSNAVYYALQRSFGGLRPEKIDPFDRMKAASGMVAWAATTGFDVRDKTVLEVGTGRMVDLPIGMWLCGAARVITVDLNRYLSATLVAEARSIVRRSREKLVDLFGRKDDPQFEERLSVLVGTHVPDSKLLKAMNVEYMSPADAANLPLAAGSVDMHVSHTVMEHIPRNVLAAILAEAGRVIAPGGLLIHNIDPSDHFSHDDASITRINFLRFTESEWERWGGNQFMYHNRLRAADYERLFADAGVRILDEKRMVDSRSVAALLDGFPLADGFRNLDSDELATTSLALMGAFDVSVQARADSFPRDFIVAR